MNLLFDVGNTRTKIAFFDEKGIVGKVWTRPKPLIRDIKKFIGKKEISKVGICRVGKFPESVFQFLKRSYDLVELTEKTKIPISNKYKSPKTLGKDRLAAILGAFALYPKNPCLVIDAGTCVTYDLLNLKREYLGGAISPGIHLRFMAMNNYTASLPLVPFSEKADFLGKDTVESLQSGAQWGLILEIEGFIKKYRQHFPGLKVLVTGGDAKYLAKNLKTKIFVNPNLVLAGLNEIL